MKKETLQISLWKANWMTNQVKVRQEQALAAIKSIFGTDAGDSSINWFIEHHLDELDENYWEQYLNSKTPEPKDVLGLLQFFSSWGKDQIEYFDFTLPGEVTDYVVSVHFDSDGKIIEVSMES